MSLKNIFSIFKKKTYTPGSIGEVLAIALPLIINGSAYTIMQFSDRWFLAKHSEVAINASMPSAVLSFTMLSLITFVVQYSSTFVAQNFGAGRKENCVYSAVQGMWLAVLGLPIYLLMIPIGELLIHTFSYGPELMKAFKIYFRWMMLSGVFVGFNFALGGYFTGQNRLMPNVIAQVIGCIANIVLDYIFIFGKCGIPEYWTGIRGAAVATVISTTIPCVIQFVWMLRDKLVRELGLREVFKFRPAAFKSLLKYGAPSGFQMFFDNGCFSVFLLMVATLPAVQAVASNVAFSLNNLAFSPLLSFGNATSIVVAQHKGAGNDKIAKKSGWSGLKLGLCYMMIMFVVFVVFPRSLMGLFMPLDCEFRLDDLVEIGRQLMLIMAIWGIFDTANIIFIGSLKGVGDTKFVMTLLLVCAWAFWMPGEVLIFHFNLGIVWCWIWMAVYIAVLGIIFMVRWHNEKWREIKILN